jgi:hypothetical protein
LVTSFLMAVPASRRWPRSSYALRLPIVLDLDAARS